MGKESENPVGAIQQSAGDQEKQQPFYLYYNFRRKKPTVKRQPIYFNKSTHKDISVYIYVYEEEEELVISFRVLSLLRVSYRRK